MKPKMTVHGADGLERLLKALPDKVFKKELAAAVRFSVKPWVSTARRKVKTVSKTVAKALAVKVKKYPKTGSVAAVVGPRSGQKNPETGTIPDYIAHVLEYGTRPHSLASGSRLAWSGPKQRRYAKGQDKGAMHPGIEPQPFLRPAFDAHEHEAVGRMRQRLAKGVLNQAAKLKR